MLLLKNVLIIFFTFFYKNIVHFNLKSQNFQDRSLEFIDFPNLYFRVIFMNVLVAFFSIKRYSWNFYYAKNSFKRSFQINRNFLLFRWLVWPSKNFLSTLQKEKRRRRRKEGADPCFVKRSAITRLKRLNNGIWFSTI